MRKALVLSSAAVLIGCGIARAADSATPQMIPPDFIQLFAPIAVQTIQAQFPNPPVKLEPVPEKTVGYHIESQVAVVAMPDKNLTDKTLDELADKEVPVALFVTKDLTLQDKTAALAKEKVALADVDGKIKIPVFYLVAKKTGEDRSLLIYSKENKPVATVALKKPEGDAAKPAADAPPVALKLTDIDLEKKTMSVTVSVEGGYQSTVKRAQTEL